MDRVDQFEAFVRRFQDMVYATALRLLGEPADAEDVAQTVFLRAYRDFDILRTNPASPGWLKATTTNLCLNHLNRHRARWQLFSELDREEEGKGADLTGILSRLSIESREGSGESRADERPELYEKVEGALQSLPDHQRVPLVLYHFEERSYQEIASALGISLGKVKTDIHRGREALKRKMGSGSSESVRSGPQEGAKVERG